MFNFTARFFFSSIFWRRVTRSCQKVESSPARHESNEKDDTILQRGKLAAGMFTVQQRWSSWRGHARNGRTARIWYNVPTSSTLAKLQGHNTRTQASSTVFLMKLFHFDFAGGWRPQLMFHEDHAREAAADDHEARVLQSALVIAVNV